MVCNRCILVVQQELERAGLKPLSVSLGEVELERDPGQKALDNLAVRLNALDFEILDDQKKKQIEKIKNLLIAQVRTGHIPEHFSLADFLSAKLHKEYSQISRLFSEVESVTIEQFFILQKIEKVKEWLVYKELTLSEIAWKLGYSSVAHLSAQFKKVTGLTPSHFKELGGQKRKPLDQIK